MPLTDVLLVPDWPAPTSIKAASTTRQGGVSEGMFASLNLGYHVDDERTCVSENRRRLVDTLNLPQEPAWLRQVHGNTVVDASAIEGQVEADAAYADKKDVVCAIMTADCLPVLLCDQAGTQVAAAHAGWRGLVKGVIAETVKALPAEPADLLAWLGPAIGPEVFEVGPEVRTAFLELDSANSVCFKPSPAGHWLADIYELARRQLKSLDVTAIYGGDWCTYSQPEQFYSYRRDGSSGRMASLIWCQSSP